MFRQAWLYCNRLRWWTKFQADQAAKRGRPEVAKLHCYDGVFSGGDVSFVRNQCFHYQEAMSPLARAGYVCFIKKRCLFYQGSMQGEFFLFIGVPTGDRLDPGSGPSRRAAPGHAGHAGPDQGDAFPGPLDWTAAT